MVSLINNIGCSLLGEFNDEIISLYSKTINMKAIKNILFDMGGVVFCQNSAEAYQRFKNIGIDAHLYMGDYGQKDFFLDVETGAITADEFCRKLEEITLIASIINEDKYV